MMRSAWLCALMLPALARAEAPPLTLRLATQLHWEDHIDLRRRPGPLRAVAPVRASVDLNHANALLPVAPPPEPWRPRDDGAAPVPDRWRILDSLGLIQERWYDPYHQNTWKGDKPVIGEDWFVNVSVISDTVYEPRRLPTPVGPQSATDPGSLDIFGDPEQWIASENLIVALTFLQGDTTFRPPNYEFHFTPVFNFNYAHAEEQRALTIDPRGGKDRNDEHIGVQELFADVHLRNVSDRYDFDSARIGIQPFSSDFRGFLFQDNEPAVRLFGNRLNNRLQYNLAYIRRLEKDTNSGLNDVGTHPRNDDTLIANVYFQDFPRLGFTSQLIAAHNRNREQNLFYDANGFLQRPASFGDERGRSYQVTYVGYNGDGHFGRFNLTASTYLALGRESRGVFIDDARSIRASFAAAEGSVDFDWMRLRLSGLHASGDGDPYDDQANGFDSIFENPIFAGADTSFWIRQSVPLVGGGGVGISMRNGVLNDLRSSREHGQSNFDNPGTALVGAGADFDLRPDLRFSANANHLWFDDTAVLEAARNQGGIDSDIGWDLSGALIWRPLLSQNVVLRVSGAWLVPGAGFRELFPGITPYSVLANLIVAY
jgi:hypothetical protein